MAKGGNGKANPTKFAPVLDDASIVFESTSSLSYDYTAFDADKNEKLSYAFLVNGVQSLSYEAADGAVFTIDSATGHVSSAAPLLFDPDVKYVLNVQVTDKFKLTDIGVLTIDFCTEYSIDNGRDLADGPELVNAGSDAFCFTTDAGVGTYVGLGFFTSDDRIVVSGVGSLDEYSFSTGVGGGADDLYITYSNTATGTLDIIVIGDIISTPGLVFDYATAVTAVGFDFMSLA